MFERRLGTIQSFRPGYAGLMPQFAPYGKPPAGFQRQSTLITGPQLQDGTAAGSNLRPATAAHGDIERALCLLDALRIESAHIVGCPMEEQSLLN
ncbi:hypothetical protein [Mesorhizobium sp. M1E.F.Ca.ET.063.01.1.1]|nr:hypothetical protein [Mesorhizobium sp. M1E.F.Ca.ET.063.01.1.1]